MTRGGVGRLVRGSLALSLAVLVAAGCGGDDESASSGGNGGEGGAASGEPIKLANISTVENPAVSAADIVAATEAWIAYVNDELGGIDGRPLELVKCDDRGDPALAVQCANNLLAEDVVGFVGSWSLVFGANALARAEEAGAPIFGGWPITPEEWTSEIEFPVTAGSAGTYPGLGLAMRANGVENLAGIWIETPAAVTNSKEVEQIWPDLGGEQYEAVFYPPTAADYTPTASSAVKDDPDGVFLALTTATAGRMIPALANTGWDGVLGINGLSATKEVLDAAGSDLEGVFVQLPGIFTGDSEDYQLFKRVMADAGVSENAQSIVGAAGVQYVYDVLSSIDGDITRESALEAAKATTEWPGFLTHPMSDEFAPEQYPALRNPYNTFARYVGGNLEPVAIEDGFESYVSRQDGVDFVSGFPVGG